MENFKARQDIYRSRLEAKLKLYQRLGGLNAVLFYLVLMAILADAYGAFDYPEFALMLLSVALPALFSSGKECAIALSSTKRDLKEVDEIGLVKQRRLS